MIEYKLSDLFDLQMGKTPSRNNPEYWNSNDNKWISIGDLSKCGKYISETKEYLSDLAVTESGISLIPADTVVMSFKLSIGKTAITAEPMYSNEAIMSFRDKHVVDLLPDYIYYMFSGKDWDAGTNKAVMGKTLNKATLSSIKIRVHEIEEQRRIVAILDKVSSVIDHRQRELQSFDDLIKARFVEMFGNVQNNVFGFAEGTLESVSDEFFAGGDKPADCVLEKDEDHPYPVYANGYENEGLQGYSEKCRVIKPAVTISARGTIGYCFIRNAGFTPIVRLVTIVPNNKVSPVFLKYAIDAMDIKSSGTSQAQLTVPDCKRERIVVPPIEIQDQFAAFVSQVDKSKSAVQKALDEAQTLFDSLMQKYFG